MPIRLEDIDHFEDDIAFLVGVDFGRGALTADESMAELATLAEAAGSTVIGGTLQNLSRPNSRFFIGSGKVEEVRVEAKELNANLIILDQELSPSQQRNLEEEIDIRVIDRTTLILDIFAQRANTSEGRLQVELAQLDYLLPRLRGWGESLTRTGGGIGTRGPGETKLEADKQRLNKRIHDLKRKLKKVTKRRELARANRSNIPVVAIVGYTNSGKSTLLNKLSGSEDFAADMPFATLDPHVKRIKLPSGRTVLLSDTVGFISRLPTNLIAAFKSTLEEVSFADVLLVVHDLGSDNIDGRARVVESILTDLGARETPRLNLFNKVDTIETGFNAERFHTAGYDNPFAISATDGTGVDEMVTALDRLISRTGTRTYFRVPVERGDIIADLYSRSRVVSVEIDGESQIVVAVVNDEIKRRYNDFIKEPKTEN